MTDPLIFTATPHWPDASIDLETLSTRGDAAVLSIGVTAFDRMTGALGPRLHVNINIDDAIKHGHVSGSTLAWWMQQEAAAKEVAFNGDSGLASALSALSSFIGTLPGVRVWGNGATFDIGILEYAYKKIGVPPPWLFYNIRDMRTIVDLAEDMGFDKRSIVFEGTAHNAGDDSAHQARVISAAYKHVTDEYWQSAPVLTDVIHPATEPTPSHPV